MNKYEILDVNTHDLEPWPLFQDQLPLAVLEAALASHGISLETAKPEYEESTLEQYLAFKHARGTTNQMTTQITKPTEGLGRGAIRRADRAIKKAVLGTLVSDLDLNFVYLRDFDPMTGDMAPTGGTVLAYRIPMNGATVLEVASSICSPKDQFDKLEGKFRAASNFAEGRKILVKIASGGKYGKQLGAMFSNLNI